MAKIFERILHDQVHGFFEAHGLLDPCQSGFRPGHSTVSCAAGVLNNIYRSLDVGGLTGAFSLTCARPLILSLTPYSVLSWLGMV